MRPFIEAMSNFSDALIICYPNAGGAFRIFIYPQFASDNSFLHVLDIFCLLKRFLQKRACSFDDIALLGLVLRSYFGILRLLF